MVNMKKNVTENTAPPSTETEAQTIWNTIKDKEINMFAIPGKVSDYCNFMAVDPNKCYLTYKATAVLPAMEELLAGKYDVSSVDKYLLVSKKTNAF